MKISWSFFKKNLFKIRISLNGLLKKGLDYSLFHTSLNIHTFSPLHCELLKGKDCLTHMDLSIHMLLKRRSHGWGSITVQLIKLVLYFGQSSSDYMTLLPQSNYKGERWSFLSKKDSYYKTHNIYFLRIWMTKEGQDL